MGAQFLRQLSWKKSLSCFPSDSIPGILKEVRVFQQVSKHTYFDTKYRNLVLFSGETI